MTPNFYPFTSYIYLHWRSIDLLCPNLEYIIGIKDGGVDIDVGLDIDNIDILKDKCCDGKGYIKLKIFRNKIGESKGGE